MKITDLKMPINFILNESIKLLFNKIHTKSIVPDKINFNIVTEFADNYTCRLFSVPDNKENTQYRFKINEINKIIFVDKVFISNFDKLKIICLFLLFWIDKFKFNETKYLIIIFKKYINPEITKLKYN